MVQSLRASSASSTWTRLAYLDQLEFFVWLVTEMFERLLQIQLGSQMLAENVYFRNDKHKIKSRVDIKLLTAIDEI